MSITINGTTGVSGVDGSSTTPAFQGTDTNTGLFYGTDIVGISTGGSERVRVDASGNVGIGTSSPTQKLEVISQIVLFRSSQSANTDTDIRILGGAYTGNPTTIIVSSGTVAENRVDYGGNTATGEPATAHYWWTGTVGTKATGSEKMRLTNAGELWVAKTTDAGAFNIQCGGTGVWGAGAYTNGSDARIKDDIQPITSSLEVVNKLNPVTFKYKEDWSKNQSVQTGFIAQELQETLKDEIYIDGLVNTGGEYLSVAYQNIIPLLTKAIQEQQTIINDLKARVTALEASNV